MNQLLNRKFHLPVQDQMHHRNHCSDVSIEKTVSLVLVSIFLSASSLWCALPLKLAVLKSIILSFWNEVSLSAIPACLNGEWLALHGAFCNPPHGGRHMKISITIQSVLHTVAEYNSWGWDSLFCWPWLPQGALGRFCDSLNKCSVKGLQRLQLLFLLYKVEEQETPI